MNYVLWFSLITLNEITISKGNRGSFVSSLTQIIITYRTKWKNQDTLKLTCVQSWAEEESVKEKNFQIFPRW